MKTKSKANWFDLNAYPGYQVSDDGRVRDRWGNKLSIHLDEDGCRSVHLPVNGVRTPLPVKVLVGYAFYGIPSARYQVVHLDGIEDDSPGNVAVVERDQSPVDYELLMRTPPRQKAPTFDWHGQYPVDDDHGRSKVARTCNHGHRLSMTGEPDDSTAMHGYGNRICRRCWPEHLDDVVRVAHAGGGRW